MPEVAAAEQPKEDKKGRKDKNQRERKPKQKQGEALVYRPKQ